MEIHYTKTNRLSPQEEQCAIYHSEPEYVLAMSQFLPINSAHSRIPEPAPNSVTA
jgi:hypothetical protein